MLDMPKQKLNEKQQKLWCEWTEKEKELEKNNPPIAVNMARLDGPLKQKRKELQKKYMKMIKEAADKHS